jgi:hypothetical protein
LDIIGDAARMDAEMAKQRAVYRIYMQPVRPRLEFHNGSMIPAPEDARAARDQADTVAVVVRPALVRTGRSSGQDYSAATYLVDMEVWLQDVEETARGGRSEQRHGPRAEHPGPREQQPQQRAALHKPSVDVARPRAQDRGGGAPARRPVQNA